MAESTPLLAAREAAEHEYPLGEPGLCGLRLAFQKGWQARDTQRLEVRDEAVEAHNAIYTEFVETEDLSPFDVDKRAIAAALAVLQPKMEEGRA